MYDVKKLFEQVKTRTPLTENQLRFICEQVKEILVEEANVQVFCFNSIE